MSELLTVGQAAALAGGHPATHGADRHLGQHRRIVAAFVAAPAAPSEAVATATGCQASVTPATRVTAAPDSGSLAELIERLTDRLAEQTALTAIWQERARVLYDQLALKAPETPVAAQPEPAPAQAPGPRVTLARLALLVAVGARGGRLRVAQPAGGVALVRASTLILTDDIAYDVILT